jgi:hypothetical protein
LEANKQDVDLNINLRESDKNIFEIGLPMIICSSGVLVEFDVKKSNFKMM